jgi:hypothetical protein
MRWSQTLLALATMTALLLGGTHSQGGMAPQQKGKKAAYVTGTVTAINPTTDADKDELATVTVRAAPAVKGTPTTEQTFTITKTTKIEQNEAKAVKKIQEGTTTDATLTDIKVGSVLYIHLRSNQAREAEEVLILGVRKN